VSGSSGRLKRRLELRASGLRAYDSFLNIVWNSENGEISRAGNDLALLQNAREKWQQLVFNALGELVSVCARELFEPMWDSVASESSVEVMRLHQERGIEVLCPCVEGYTTPSRKIRSVPFLDRAETRSSPWLRKLTP
jgi:hypothetical protein